MGHVLQSPNPFAKTGQDESYHLSTWANWWKELEKLGSGSGQGLSTLAQPGSYGRECEWSSVGFGVLRLQGGPWSNSHSSPLVPCFPPKSLMTISVS